MTTVGIRYAIAAAIGGALLMPAMTAPAAHADAAVLKPAISDFSAQAQQKKRKRQMQHAPVAEPRIRSGWRAADPSFDQQGRLYRPPPGLDCPVDLGYGRWGSCNFDN